MTPTTESQQDARTTTGRDILFPLLLLQKAQLSPPHPGASRATNTVAGPVQEHVPE